MKRKLIEWQRTRTEKYGASKTKLAKLRKHINGGEGGWVFCLGMTFLLLLLCCDFNKIVTEKYHSRLTNGSFSGVARLQAKNILSN